MEFSEGRDAPSFWRHDRYTLMQLQTVIESALEKLQWNGFPESRNAAQVVDIGAGAAPYRELFQRRSADYTTCDLVDGDGPHANEPDVRLEPGERIPMADASADYVVSFQVLEHVWDLDWYLGECRRLLRGNGRLLLSTHGVWLFHPHPTDFRRWTRDGLVAELESRGFIVESITGVVGPLAWTTQFRSLGYHHLLTRVPLLGRWLSAAVCTFMNIRMSLEDAITPRLQIDTNAAIYLLVARIDLALKDRV